MHSKYNIEQLEIYYIIRQMANNIPTSTILYCMGRFIFKQKEPGLKEILSFFSVIKISVKTSKNNNSLYKIVS